MFENGSLIWVSSPGPEYSAGTWTEWGGGVFPQYGWKIPYCDEVILPCPDAFQV